MKTMRLRYLSIMAAVGLVTSFGLVGCSDDDGGTSCTPMAEECNGFDDDCDGLTDEDLEQSCVDGNGVAGTQTCQNGSWGTCETDCTPVAEECNGLDDDCDGQTDEGGSSGQLRRTCTSDCGTGYEYCFDGQWEQCDAPQPETEDCDGVDNDCDGETDEGCDCVHGTQRPCGTNEGVCQEGTEECVDGSWSGDCVGEVEAAADDSDCNGLDDDCDGDIDEDCSCTPGNTQPCGTDEGECSMGEQTCITGGVWGDCTGDVEPVSEDTAGCDGLDNDCDGETDEDLPGDDYESNDTCAQFRDLGQIEEGSGIETFELGTLYPENDVDWYKIQVTEATHICVPGDDQCYFVFYTDITLPSDVSPDDVLITLYADDDGQCGGDQLEFDSTDPMDWNGQTWSLVLEWTGLCGLTDSWDFLVKVEDISANGMRSCNPYTMDFEMIYTDEECPQTP